MGPLAWIAAGLGLWITALSFIYLVIVPRLRRGPGQDAFLGLCWWLLRIYGRVIHRVKATGLEHLPTTTHPGPLVVVANHTGSVDPLLISRFCPFMISWMMGDDLMFERMMPLWEKLRLIPVDRSGQSSIAFKSAIRKLRDDGVVGIFPEGRISLPRGEIRPFFDGVGGIIARGKADTLLVWIDGTPETSAIIPSLFGRSHATVHFIEYIPYDGERNPSVITERLRSKLLAASGWTANEESMPLLLPGTGAF